MSRRRYVHRDGKLVEVTHEPAQDAGKNYDGILWNDRAYQDMNDPRFNSRKSHRQYMRDNNLSTVDDYTEQWKKQAEAREKFLQGIDPSRRDDVARALGERFRRG